MRLRFLVPAFALSFGIGLPGCSSDPVSIDQPCPGDLVRDADGECVRSPGTCDPAGLRVSEVFFNPVGEEDEQDFEFVEISGSPSQSVEGMRVAIVDADARRVHEAELSGRTNADGVHVVGGARTEFDSALGGLIGNSQGAIQLIDCDNTVVDAVAWGTFPDGSAFPGEGDTATIPPEGASLGRCPSATDTGDNSADFGVSAPSAGTANPGESFADPLFCGGAPTGCDPGALAGQIRIEELLYNPEGSDAGNEFIELRMPPNLAVDGVRIEGINGANGRELFPPIILAGAADDTGIFVVGGAAVPNLDFPLGEVTLQNGPDTIQVVDCDGRQVLDAIGFGEFERDETFAGETRPAAAVAEGLSLSRCAAAADNDDNSIDFGASTPTPGVAAADTDFASEAFCAGGGGPCVLGQLDIEINEVLYDPDGTDTGFEFVELRGPAGTPLTRASLVAINGASGEGYGTPVPLAGVFDENGLFVVGGLEVSERDIELPFTLQNGPDSIVVYDCDGESRLDSLGYGSFGDGEFFNGEGSSAPVATAGAVLARCSNREDTGDNATDFGVATASPGVPNTEFADPLFCDFDPTACVIGASGSLRINEVVANPEGGDTDAAAEFVELRGTAGQVVTGLWIAGVNGSNGEPFIGPFRLIGAANAEGYFVVGQENVAGADQALLGALQNGPESIVLYDCDGVSRLDAVGYGSFDETDFFAGEGSAAPVADGRSTARCEDIPDSNDNAADFGLADPTPGAANSGFSNPLLCAGECVPIPAGSVVINEVFYNPEGADGAGEAEFVELRGAAGRDITGVSLTGVNGDSGADYAGPIGVLGELDSNGFFVFGGSSVAGAQTRFPSAMQNGPDSLVLRDCEGTVIDAVAYGVFGDDEFPAGEGNPAPTADGTSIGRSGGADSNDNAADFSVQTAPSPGAEND